MSDTYSYRMEKPVDYVPHRVVSLVPSLTETLFDLALGDRLVGRTDYCVYPADQVGRVPKLGGTKNPDIDRIVALQPDLVLMNREENRIEDAEKLKAAGLAVWATQPNTIREALDLLWTIMDVFEHPVMVQRVRSIEINYEWTLGVAADTGRKKVFVPIWRDPWMTANRETFLHDMLFTCGGENVFADRDRRYPLSADLGQSEPQDSAGRDTRYPRVTLDEIVAAQPEIVLLPSEPYAFTESDKEIFAKLDIPAAQTGDIHLVDGSLLTWHGTRIASALRDLPSIFNLVPR
jgi:ABC-type Fe3+-hydroxamate transport system substrate-binding protein